jgi:alkylated DNA repair dioxygenase AlkB
MQADLFQGRASAALVDDARGTIAYFPDAVPRRDADRWFAALRDAVDWSSERRMMYDREVDVPRLMAHFALDAAGLPRELAAAAAVASRVCGHAFNSVGLNFYRDGSDSVAPHNDKLHELAAGAPIAIVSLGATRRMTISTKSRPRQMIQLDLEHGSLLTMSYESQRHFDHSIPKSRFAVGPRISLAFRCRPATLDRQDPQAGSKDNHEGHEKRKSSWQARMEFLPARE